MKINLFDISYGTIRKYEMEDQNLATDLDLMFGYLDSYKKELENFIKNSKPNEEFAYQIVWEARIKVIEKFKEKHKKLLDFIHEIQEEETSL